MVKKLYGSCVNKMFSIFPSCIVIERKKKTFKIIVLKVWFIKKPLGLSSRTPLRYSLTSKSSNVLMYSEDFTRSCS